MRVLLIALVLTAPGPAFAQSAEKVVEDAAMTPVEDVNLKKREIPPVLLSAQDDPYSAEGTRSCSQLRVALEELDAVLGPDFDSGTPTRTGLNATSVAKSVVGSFIPFRGVIRELTGAAGDKRRYEAAVDAGIAGRGYLRGVARSRGCKPVVSSAAANN
jgi:hypothetical protein